MGRSIVSTSDSVRRGRISEAVEQVCATDGKPRVKARMLREPAAWYQAFAARAARLIPPYGSHACLRRTIWRRRPVASIPNYKWPANGAVGRSTGEGR